MKLLGIDFGEKRIGLALSDDEGRIAFPNSVIINNEKSLDLIKNICNENKVETVIIGESKDYNMKDNPVMESAKKFSEKLEDKGFKIIFHPEFMTSMQVSREIHHANTPREQKVRGEKGGEIDAQAATIILQSYIDSNK